MRDNLSYSFVDLIVSCVVVQELAKHDGGGGEDEERLNKCWYLQPSTWVPTLVMYFVTESNAKLLSGFVNQPLLGVYWVLSVQYSLSFLDPKENVSPSSSE